MGVHTECDFVVLGPPQDVSAMEVRIMTSKALFVAQINLIDGPSTSSDGRVDDTSTDVLDDASDDGAHLHQNLNFLDIHWGRGATHREARGESSTLGEGKGKGEAEGLGEAAETRLHTTVKGVLRLRPQGKGEESHEATRVGA